MLEGFDFDSAGEVASEDSEVLDGLNSGLEGKLQPKSLHAERPETRQRMICSQPVTSLSLPGPKSWLQILRDQALDTNV